MYRKHRKGGKPVRPARPSGPRSTAGETPHLPVKAPARSTEKTSSGGNPSNKRLPAPDQATLETHIETAEKTLKTLDYRMSDVPTPENLPADLKKKEIHELLPEIAEKSEIA